MRKWNCKKNYFSPLIIICIFANQKNNKLIYNGKNIITWWRGYRAWSHSRRSEWRVRLSGHPVNRDYWIYSKQPHRQGAQDSLPVVHQRKDRYGGGSRYVLRRQEGVGMYEARRYERLRWRFCQFSRYGRQWRTRGFGSRRPLDALLAKRTGFEVLRQICTHSNPRTEQPTGGLRYDEGGLWTQRKIARACFAEGCNETCAQPRSRWGWRTGRRKRLQSEHGTRLGVVARHRQKTVRRTPRKTAPDARSRRKFALQPQWKIRHKTRRCGLWHWLQLRKRSNRQFQNRRHQLAQNFAVSIAWK